MSNKLLSDVTNKIMRSVAAHELERLLLAFGVNATCVDYESERKLWMSIALWTSLQTIVPILILLVYLATGYFAEGWFFLILATMIGFGTMIMILHDRPEKVTSFSKLWDEAILVKLKNQSGTLYFGLSDYGRGNISGLVA